MNESSIIQKINTIDIVMKENSLQELRQAIYGLVKPTNWIAILILSRIYKEPSISDKVKTIMADIYIEKLTNLSKFFPENNPPLDNDIDQGLISSAFSLLAFENNEFRNAIRQINKKIIQKLKMKKLSHIDSLSSKDCASIILSEFQGTTYGVTEKFLEFLIEMLNISSFYKNPIRKKKLANISVLFPRLIIRAAQKIEQPDRIFTYFRDIDLVSRYADNIFVNQKDSSTHFFSHYSWAYPRNMGFRNLNYFWIVSMVATILITHTVSCLCDESLPSPRQIAFTSMTSKCSSEGRIQRTWPFSDNSYSLIKPSFD